MSVAFCPKAAARIARNRREFLRTAIGAGAAARFLSAQNAGRALGIPASHKVVVVTFGGGARDEETLMPDGQENIPNLLGHLLPRGTFYGQMINEGILGHYVATASLATGVYETFNNFAAVAPESPTVFEYFRRDLRRPARDAWVIAPSNGFNRIGESAAGNFGPGGGAGVILPKRLLASALSPAGSNLYEHLLRDNYETPLYAPGLEGHGLDASQIAEILKLSLSEFAAQSRNLRSPDELSVYIAKHLMAELAPSLIWITLHDIDIAHSGCYSLYLEAIQRSDRLCAEIYQMIESNPEYRGRTTFFVLPDFGRDGDLSPGGNGFQHHRTGDALARTTWMLAIGPGIRENVVIERPVRSIDLVPTLGRKLGFTPERAGGQPLSELV